MVFSHDFQYGQAVWDENRRFHPNGVIFDINWEDEFVMVHFTNGDYEQYDFDTLYGCWTDKFGGGWRLP